MATEILLATVRGDREKSLEQLARSTLSASNTAWTGDPRRQTDTFALPSFVEILFLEQMGAMVKASTSHVASSLADAQGASLAALLVAENFDLVFMLAAFCLQFYAIEGNGASVAESLYGLKRVSVGADGSVISDQLSPLQRLLSVHSLSLAPYLVDEVERFATYHRRRADAAAGRARRADEDVGSSSGSSGERSGSSSSSSSSDASLLQGYLRWWTVTVLTFVARLRRRMYRVVDGALLAFGRVFPYVKAAYKLLVWGQKVLYLFGSTPYVHPVLRLINVALVKRGEAPRPALSAQEQEQGEGKPGAGRATDEQQLQRQRGLEVGAAVVVVAFLAIRAAETTLRLGRERRPAVVNGNNGSGGPLAFLWARLRQPGGGGGGGPSVPLAAVPPPEAPTVGRGCVIPPRDGKCCPLCRQPRRMPCVTTGGYVFCYPCLLPALREHPVCPVSALPCTEHDIVRLYETDD